MRFHPAQLEEGVSVVGAQLQGTLRLVAGGLVVVVLEPIHLSQGYMRLCQIGRQRQRTSGTVLGGTQIVDGSIVIEVIGISAGSRQSGPRQSEAWILRDGLFIGRDGFRQICRPRTLGACFVVEMLGTQIVVVSLWIACWHHGYGLRFRQRE